MRKSCEMKSMREPSGWLGTARTGDRFGRVANLEIAGIGVGTGAHLSKDDRAMHCVPFDGGRIGVMTIRDGAGRSLRCRSGEIPVRYGKAPGALRFRRPESSEPRTGFGIEEMQVPRTEC